MTIKNLDNQIKKTKTKISKGNFKGNEEGELHMKLDGLRGIKNGLQRLENQLENLLNN